LAPAAAATAAADAPAAAGKKPRKYNTRKKESEQENAQPAEPALPVVSLRVVTTQQHASHVLYPLPSWQAEADHRTAKLQVQRGLQDATKHSPSASIYKSTLSPQRLPRLVNTHPHPSCSCCIDFALADPITNHAHPIPIQIPPTYPHHPLCCCCPPPSASGLPADADQVLHNRGNRAAHRRVRCVWAAGWQQ
jgi:hypothetical protein